MGAENKILKNMPSIPQCSMNLMAILSNSGGTAGRGCRGRCRKMGKCIGNYGDGHTFIASFASSAERLSTWAKRNVEYFTGSDLVILNADSL
jgi:hypothetical protein